MKNPKSEITQHKSTLVIAALLLFSFLVSSEMSSLLSSDQWISKLGLSNAPENFFKKIFNFGSHIFLSFDLAQLSVNLLLLGMVSKYENLMGSLYFFSAFFLSGVLSGLLVFLNTDLYVMAGSTSAFFGLVGAVCLEPKKRSWTFYGQVFFLFLLINVLFNFSRGSLSPSPFQFEVNNLSHICGLACGLVLATLRRKYILLNQNHPG